MTTLSENGDMGQIGKTSQLSFLTKEALQHAKFHFYLHIQCDSSKSIPVQKPHYIHCKTMTIQSPCCYKRHTDLV